MKRVIKIIFFLAFIVSTAYALRSPIDERFIRITSTFGEFRPGHFHNGVDIGGNKMPIYPIYDGEIVFYFDETEDPTRTVYGSGNLLVIEHENDLRSYYYHIYEGSIVKDVKNVKEASPMALTGNSGRSGGPHLHITIENMLENKVVNPLDYIKTFSDKKPPVIFGIYFRTEKSLIQIRDRMDMRYSGQIKLFVKAYDLVGGITTGLKRVRIFMNGTLMRDYDFNALIKKNNVYHIEPDYKFEDVFGVDPHFYRGGVFTPTRGKYIFTAEITDFGGNMTTLSRTVNFW